MHIVAQPILPAHPLDARPGITADFETKAHCPGCVRKNGGYDRLDKFRGIGTRKCWNQHGTCVFANRNSWDLTCCMSFPDTNWTVLVHASLNGDDENREALSEVCATYWKPVHTAICATGVGRTDASDLTQSFFAYLMKNSTLSRVERGRGLFRTFLTRVLLRFLRDERCKAHAAKRGGGQFVQSLDELDDSQTPAEVNHLTEVLDRAWAIAVFERVIESVRGEVIAARGEEAWKTLRKFLPGSHHLPLAAEAAGVLGLSEAGLRTEVHRLRLRCREALRREVMVTTSSPGEIDEELAYIGRILQKR
jgi:DNA-directed RNA polymerase specialized sigma24 family protein